MDTSAASKSNQRVSQDARVSETTRGGGVIEGNSQLQQQPNLTVAGEATPSVCVQSQLATSTIQSGVGETRSNLSAVLGQLASTHHANSEWFQAETDKINRWGHESIQRILAQTKRVEDEAVQAAREQQCQIEQQHKVELARMVQQLDVNQATRLKEVEDTLQKKIQDALTASKNEIQRIESDMTHRKHRILEESTKHSSNAQQLLEPLQVQAKLAPSITRTVIETSTSTGEVQGVTDASMPAAASTAPSSASAAPLEARSTPGVVTMSGTAQTGDIVRNADQKTVGTAAFVTTKTDVTQPQQQQQQIQMQQPSSSSAVSTTATTDPTHSKRIDAAYGKPLVVGASHPSTAAGGGAEDWPKDDGRHVRDAGKDASVHRGKQHDTKHARSGAASGEKQHESLIDKVKHAITGSEPKSGDASRNKV